MLQHSRTSSGQKELTDINTFADEYLRLAYHGFVQKTNLQCKFETDFDPSIEKINVVPQDIGRVLLNLINNAFYAVSEKTEAPEVVKAMNLQLQLLQRNRMEELKSGLRIMATVFHKNIG